MSGRTGLVLAALIAVGGCAATSDSGRPPLAQPGSVAGAAEAAEGAKPGETASGAEGLRQSADPRQMQEVMAEVEAVGRMDPAAQSELLASLRETTPDLWPLVARQFRAALAYRVQAAQRGGAAEAHLAAWDGQAVAGSRPVAAGGTQTPTGPPTPGPDVSGPGPSPGPSPPSAGAMGESRLASGRSGSGDPAEPRAFAGPRPSRPGPAGASGGGPAGEEPVQPGSRPAAAGPDQVVAATYRDGSGRPDTSDWRKAVDAAIRAVQAQAGDASQSEEALAAALRLRLLHLVADRRDEALAPISGLATPLQDFWSKELFGLATLLDTRGITDQTIRVAEARRHLDEAVASLAESAPLVVRNLAFVTRVENFGTFTPFEKYEFQPGQWVILYAEVENFKSTATAQGYYTALKSSYQIFDSRGQRVADHESETNEEYCRNRRRDFFIGYEFSMPQRIYPGRHVLQLTVADLNSQKIGQSSIEFTIADPDQ